MCSSIILSDEFPQEPERGTIVFQVAVHKKTHQKKNYLWLRHDLII